MKMLTLAVVLMFLPLLSHAKGTQYYGYENHHQKHGELSFWENVERRQYELHRSTDRGVKKGQLTRREVRKIEREQKSLAKNIRHSKRFHSISSSSRRKIMEQLEHVSCKIDDLRHNKYYVRYVKNRYILGNHQTYTHYDHEPIDKKKRYQSVDHNSYSAGLHLRF